jgi:hypothetical protein
LFLNFARSSGTHPSHKMRLHCRSRDTALLSKPKERTGVTFNSGSNLNPCERTEVATRRLVKCTTNARNYWVFGLCPSPSTLKLEYTTFRRLDLLPSSGEGEAPTLLGPLESANLNHWTQNPLKPACYKIRKERAHRQNRHRKPSKREQIGRSHASNLRIKDGPSVCQSRASATWAGSAVSRMTHVPK